ncbi:hypothetical protein L3Y34_005354 [Caenorhabditis briggsae]|uniref:Uncharacterized protein n=1 Tax=Caenorhabditis briggsae TaxID=6238 RepID=A0AAE9D607_CAEBR|nr:hypothetical protein L3Y34_005354 [Caenorhabditis briggsae]
MTPRKLLLCLLFGFEICPSKCKDSYVDRVCGEDQKNLWLDIVAALISSLFVDGQQLGIQPNNPRTTRVGIVTYNQGAHVIADLNNFTSVDELIDKTFRVLNQVSTSSDSYLHAGLEAANDLLEQQSFNTARGHYQKLVIVYTSEYKGTGSQDPLPLATRMKQTVSIATVAYNREDDLGVLSELTKIATPGYNFTNDEDIVAELRSAMLQVNCYCPNGWFQMRQSYANENSLKYGVCLLPVTLQATWLASKFSCRNHWNNGFLVNEYTQMKHDYVLEVVRNNTAFKQPYMYFIGLSYSNGNWQWEQPNGMDPIVFKNWNAWNPGFPTASSTAIVVVNMQTSSSTISTGWQNTRKDLASMYVCEVASCDSTNYCTAEDI